LKLLRLIDEARSELIRESSYYEARRHGTGIRFIRAVNDSFALIRSFPQGGASAAAGVRRTKVKGFPFTVVYREFNEEIVVFAIAPDRRQPGYWLPRVGGS
jgi:plasmid stabilization system protein ParE